MKTGEISSSYGPDTRKKIKIVIDGKEYEAYTEKRFKQKPIAVGHPTLDQLKVIGLLEGEPEMRNLSDMTEEQ